MNYFRVNKGIDAVITGILLTEFRAVLLLHQLEIFSNKHTKSNRTE